MIKLYNSKNKQYYFTVCGRNGQVVLTSETYTRKRDALRAAKKIIAVMKYQEIAFRDLTQK